MTARNAFALARDLALLGAESALRSPEAEVSDTHEGFRLFADRFAVLGEAMRAHVVEEGAAVRRLRGELGLSEAAYWLVALCGASELYVEAAAALSLLAEDPGVHLVTGAAFARLMRASRGIPFCDALAETMPGAAAERLGIVERCGDGASRPRSQQPLRLSAHELRGALAGAEVSAPLRLPVHREEPARATGFEARLVGGAATLLAERGALAVRSAGPRPGRQLALDLATHLRMPALFVCCGDDLPDATELVKLSGGLPVLDLHATCASRPFPADLVAHCARQLGPVVALLPLGCETPGDLPAVEAPPLSRADRKRIWSLAMGDGSQADDLALRFRVSLDEARSARRAAADALRLQGVTPLSVGAAEVAAQIRARGARQMGRLATNVPARAQLDDLVCTPQLKAQLCDIVAWYRSTALVFDEWGLAGRSALGRGLSCLFSGPPGTGKTFAAQCLAGALDLNLYRLDLSQVVSKYIGETEKLLSRVFEEAEAGHGILLFDEADALFGKRSEVKDAHDRYANVEVGYLLQRLESFDGVVILTTNLRNNLDPAFLRRLRFVLEFPLPDAKMRRRLWEQSLPPRELWDDEVDLDFFVERFRLSGGDLHNIGLAAAHLAAACGHPRLRMAHLVRATYRELEKTGHSRSREEFGPLAPLLDGVRS